MIRERRRSATLLELLIAMILTGMLMTAFLGYYWQITRMNAMYSMASRDAFQVRYAHQRLAYILERLSLKPNISPYKGKAITCFYTTDIPHEYMHGDSLVFTFDNGPDIQPEFSNGLLGRLYLSKDGELCLVSWPMPIEGKAMESDIARKEVVLEGVEELWFEFYCPDTKDSREARVSPSQQQKGREDEEPMPGKWHRTKDASGEELLGWHKEFGELPALIKIHVVRTSGDTLTFAYQVPEVKNKVVY